MKYPNLKEEKKLWKKGYQIVVGVDEAGRGALAGPVVAGAVLIYQNIKAKNLIFQPEIKKLLKKIKDSKKLSPKKRGYFYKILTHCPYLEWGIGKVSEKIIDKINILKATKLAMKKAINNLNLKLKKQNLKINYLIIDGKIKLNLTIPQKTIIKADEKVFSCTLASILAKVSRDKMMEKYHEKYPQYHFYSHKGYGTKKHYITLKKYGPSKIHRQSFKLIKP